MSVVHGIMMALCLILWLFSSPKEKGTYIIAAGLFAIAAAIYAI